MKTISFEEFIKTNGGIVLIDIDTCPVHMAMDYSTRNENISNNRKLCDRCDGTGNELFSMYRRCINCDGHGFVIIEEEK